MKIHAPFHILINAARTPSLTNSRMRPTLVRATSETKSGIALGLNRVRSIMRNYDYCPAPKPAPLRSARDRCVSYLNCPSTVRHRKSIRQARTYLLPGRFPGKSALSRRPERGRLLFPAYRHVEDLGRKCGVGQQETEVDRVRGLRRDHLRVRAHRVERLLGCARIETGQPHVHGQERLQRHRGGLRRRTRQEPGPVAPRSEEHTSELQSPMY